LYWQESSLSKYLIHCRQSREETGGDKDLVEIILRKYYGKTESKNTNEGEGNEKMKKHLKGSPQEEERSKNCPARKRDGGQKETNQELAPEGKTSVRLLVRLRHYTGGKDGEIGEQIDFW